MIKHPHAYEFPLDPTLLDELSAWRERNAPAGNRAGRLIHAAIDIGTRLVQRIRIERHGLLER